MGLIALLSLLGFGLTYVVVDAFDDDDDDDDDINSDVAEDDQINMVSSTNGDDLIEGTSGNDLIFADDGDDTIAAGDGNDRVFGQDGADIVLGEGGDDFLRGGAADDELHGGAGEDTINGDLGDDQISGADIVDYSGLLDAVLSGELDDLGDDETQATFNQYVDLDADPMEADTLNGGFGDDYIIAGSNDVVNTGEGFDEVAVGEWVDPDAPVQITDFDPSKDVIEYTYTGETEPVATFSENEDGIPTLSIDGATIAHFENAVLSELNAGNPVQFFRFT